MMSSLFSVLHHRYLARTSNRRRTIRQRNQLSEEIEAPNIWYPKSRQQHDATIDKLKSENETPLKPSFKVLLIRGFIMIVYLLLGGLVFRALEHEESTEGMRDNKLYSERQLLIKEFNISEQRLRRYEDLARKKKSDPKYWDYYQSLYFASTVTTTIGYGHITPQTQGGRIFLIVFALIGIPLNILALASVGEHITVAIFHFIRYSSTCCCKSPQIKHINIKVMLVSIFLMICMLFLGGLLYGTTEDWTYIDSIYYCFVAMATIGFGDLVPNNGLAPDSTGEKAIWFLRALYLSIGLSLVSTVFTALSNAIEEINFLLGRQKYEEWDDEKKNERKSSKKFNSIRKGGNTEKISYKHKIKKHGSTVFKYKFLHKFKRRKDENYVQTDWDSLLEESKRKYENIPHIVKNSSLLLTNKKGFTPDKYGMNTYCETNLVTLPVTPDGDTPSTNVTETESDTSVSNKTQSVLPNVHDGVKVLPRIPHYMKRMNSTPVYYERTEYSRHLPITRTASQPVGYNKNAHHRHPIHYNNNHPGTKRKHINYVIHENNNYQQYFKKNEQSPQWSNTTAYSLGDLDRKDNRRPHVFRRSHSSNDYDIIMNQC